MMFLLSSRQIALGNLYVLRRSISFFEAPFSLAISFIHTLFSSKINKMKRILMSFCVAGLALCAVEAQAQTAESQPAKSGKVEGKERVQFKKAVERTTPFKTKRTSHQIEVPTYNAAVDPVVSNILRAEKLEKMAADLEAKIAQAQADGDDVSAYEAKLAEVKAAQVSK